MEPFVRSFDVSAPLASGRRYLLSLATRFVLAMGHGVQRMKVETRQALTELVSFEVSWPLGLLLAGWHLQLRGDALAGAAQMLLAPSGATGLWSSLASFSAPLSRFTQAASDATDEAGLVAAGVYFEAAVESVSVSLLSMVLRSSTFRPVVTALATNFPPPSDLAAEYQRRAQVRTASSNSLPSSVTQDRAHSFERADFGARRLRAPASPSSLTFTESSKPSLPEGRTVAEMASTDPSERSSGVQREPTVSAYLGQIGWSDSEIAAFLAGPTRSRGA